MYLKTTLILFLLPAFLFSQIKIIDVGDKWKSRVEEAIELIKNTDTVKYEVLINNCKTVDFLIGDYSTTVPPGTIVINTKDFKLDSVNNIASILVHESYHLYLYNKGIKIPESQEEVICYKYEYDFLCKLHTVEGWLIKNAIDKIILYSK